MNSARCSHSAGMCIVPGHGSAAPRLLAVVVPLGEFDNLVDPRHAVPWLSKTNSKTGGKEKGLPYQSCSP